MLKQQALITFLALGLLCEQAHAALKIPGLGSKARKESKEESSIAPAPKSDSTDFLSPMEKRVSELPPALQDLLSQPTRPTVLQMETALSAAYGTNWPQNHKLPFPKRFRKVVDQAELLKDLAAAFAALEHIAPGGTYAALGRGVGGFADWLEGFYLSLGQTDRVRRLNVSERSFIFYRGSNQSLASRTEFVDFNRAELIGFMRTNGIDFKTMASSPPYVILDVTAWTEDSQSRQLHRAVYNDFVEQGGSPRALYPKFGMVGIPGQGKNGLRYDLDKKAFNVDGVREALANEKYLSKDGQQHIIYLPKATEQFAFGPNWHPMFDRFDIQDDGSVITTISKEQTLGSDFQLEDRLEILSEYAFFAGAVRTPKFLAEVQAAARLGGYEFPLKRTERLTKLEQPKPVQPKSAPEKAEKKKEEKLSVEKVLKAIQEWNSKVRTGRISKKDLEAQLVPIVAKLEKDYGFQSKEFEKVHRYAKDISPEFRKIWRPIVKDRRDGRSSTGNCKVTLS